MGLTSFPPGSEVEVRSNEDGFYGAWFEAIVNDYRSKYRRYSVSYTSLVAEDDPSRPLDDAITFHYVRPRPPRGPGPRGTFELHQLVDALHKDGWWRGVVSGLPEKGNGMYRVCFPTTREELEFEASDIRDQVEWVKGTWVPADFKGEQNVMFGIGTEVEVSWDEETYGAVWFVGTILKVIGTSNFLVEYKCRRVDDNESKRMLKREIVDLEYIRPSPPRSESMKFDVSAKVEAFHQDVWFSGIISEIRPSSRYIIELKHQAKELELDHRAIRPQCYWTNGHWVLSKQENCSRASTLRGTKSVGSRRKSEACKSHSPLTSVPTFSSTDGEVAAGSTTMKVEKAKGTNHDCHAYSSKSHKKIKKEKSLVEHPSMLDTMPLDCDSKTQAIIRKVPSAAGPLMSEEPKNQIKSPRPCKKLKSGQTLEDQLSNDMLVYCGPRSPRMVNRNFSSAVIGGSISKGQSKSSEPQKEFKTMHPLGEQLAYDNPQNSRDAGKNSCAAMPYHQRSTPSLNVGRTLPSISCNNNSKVIGRSNVNLNDKETKERNLHRQDKSFNRRKKMKKGKVVKQKMRFVDGLSMVGGSRAPTIIKKAGSVPVLENRNLEGHNESSEPSKKVKEENPLKNRIVDCILELGSKAQKEAGKSSSDILFLKEIPVVMDVPQHLKSLSHEIIDPNKEDEIILPLNSTLGELCHGKDISRVHDTNESIISGEGSSNCMAEGSQHQSKAANISHEVTDHLPVAGQENCIGPNDAKTNTSVLQKELVIQAPNRYRKTFDDVKQQPQGEMKKRGRGRPPNKISNRKERAQQDKKGEGSSLVLDLSHELLLSQKELAIQAPNRYRKTLDDLKQPQGEMKKRGRGRPPNKIHHRKGMKLKERAQQDKKGEGNSPVNDASNFYQHKKQVDVVDHSETPQIDSSSGGAKILGNSTIQQSIVVVSESFNPRFQEARSSLNRLGGPSDQVETQFLTSTTEEDTARDKFEPTPSGLQCGKATVDLKKTPIDHCRSSAFKQHDVCAPPLHKSIEMYTAPLDPQPGGSSPWKEDNIHDQNKLTSLESPSKTAMVKMEEWAPIYQLPKRFSPSKEDGVCDHDEVTPSRSESMKTTIEMQSVQTNPSHDGSPSNVIALPFTKQSAMWDTVHLMEAFRAVPQQPHFRPLGQYSLEFREGMAIGLMVTYANLVSSTQKLSVFDSHVVFEEKLKALVSLESNGFNVKSLRSCLEQLLQIRRSYSHIEDKKVELERKLVEREDKSHQLDALISAHDRVISEVEVDLNCYCSRRTNLRLERNNKEMEIVKLERDLQAAEEAYIYAEENFNNAIRASW